MTDELDDDRWGSFAAARRRKLTLGLRVPAARRLAWLEEALALAARSGALERRRALRGRDGDERSETREGPHPACPTMDERRR